MRKGVTVSFLCVSFCVLALIMGCFPSSVMSITSSSDFCTSLLGVPMKPIISLNVSPRRDEIDGVLYHYNNQTEASLLPTWSTNFNWLLNDVFPLRLPFWFLLWTLGEYLFHRLCHYKSRLNPLWKLHRYHHTVSIAELTSKENRWPKPSYFYFWFENLRETLEVLLGETIPALFIYQIDPLCGWPLLLFHYVYEILATDSLLEHNPDITQKNIVATFAVGQFHLEHHRNPSVNFGFTITIWDHIFGSFKTPSQ